MGCSKNKKCRTQYFFRCSCISSLIKRSGCILLVSLLANQLSGYGQTAQSRAALLQQYLLTLPYYKNISDFVNEIDSSEKVVVDSNYKTKGPGSLPLPGHIVGWPAFAGLDSIKFYVNKKFFMRTYGINNTKGTSVDDSTYFLQEAFYFPLENKAGEGWKETCKTLIKNLGKEFEKMYPSGGPTQGKVIWFSANKGFNFMPLVTMEYGTIKNRSLCFISLVLNFGEAFSE